MKRILLISELFYPNNRIGALRPSKICKFLIEKGYYIDIITAHPSKGIYNSEHCKVYFLSELSPKTDQSDEATKRIKVNGKFINQLKYFKRTLLAYQIGVKYTKKVMELFKKGILHITDYDACFTTYGPISSILIGLELKRKYHIKNWICDFRDPVVVKMCSVFMAPFYKHLQNQACKYADKIVAVSNGYAQRICGNKYQEKTYMIPNGYDISDAKSNYVAPKKSKLTLAYVGALYEGKRDISPVFRALYELDLNRNININNVNFVYAGSDYASLLYQAEKYDMCHILENRGRLSREECLYMQYDSDILVLSTWNERREEGVFPGKFLEYMLIGRPIISLTCGELPDSEVTSVMREGNFGVAYENANDEKDYMLLKAYIKNAYDSFMESGSIPFAPVPEVLIRYSYDSIIEQIEELL